MKWIDANLIAQQEAEVPKDKWEFEKLMKEKPNLNKHKISYDERNNKNLNKRNRQK